MIFMLRWGCVWCGVWGVCHTMSCNVVQFHAITQSCAMSCNVAQCRAISHTRALSKWVLRCFERYLEKFFLNFWSLPSLDILEYQTKKRHCVYICICLHMLGEYYTLYTSSLLSDFDDGMGLMFLIIIEFQ